jgi:hypothetical protein
LIVTCSLHCPLTDITFGGDFSTVTPHLAVLGAYGLVANLAAGKFLKVL